MSWTGSSDVAPLFRPLAGSGCLPNTLRCSDWDVARQPHHPCCCSASGTQVGAYVDLTLKERQCWGVEGGLPGKILDWDEARRERARPNLYHHRHQTRDAARDCQASPVLTTASLVFIWLCCVPAAQCCDIIKESRLFCLFSWPKRDRLVFTVCTVCVKQSKAWTCQQ